MLTLSPPIADFLWTFVKEAVLIFILFFSAYLVASYQLFNSAHGNTGAWDVLKKNLQAVISSEHVLTSKTLKVAAIQSTISPEARRELLELVQALQKIDEIQRRLLLLRQRRRFIGMGIILSIIFGLLLASPVLYGEPPFSDRINNFAAIISALCVGAFYYVINHRHAETWSELQSQISTLSARLQGANLEPL